jgi:ABC-type dipeptide/oligopeptide/nickel transport system permease component
VNGWLFRFVLRRVSAAALFVSAIALAALVIVHLAPGDATTELRAIGASDDTIARARERLGLDRPFVEQAARWVASAARGDLGESSLFGRPVGALVAGRLAATARLASVALLLATVIGVPLGMFTGARPSHWVARLVTPVSVALLSCPPLVGALALLWVAASTGWLSFEPGALAVPVLALSLPIAASLERLQSQAAREAMAAPDMLAAAARGIPPHRLVWVHAARQSLRPVLGVYGVLIGSLFGGAFAVEVITSWPGLGRLMYDALRGRDVNLVAGCALAGASCLMVGNLLADVARAVVDPRSGDAT